jgi:hypothetical protein
MGEGLSGGLAIQADEYCLEQLNSDGDGVGLNIYGHCGARQRAWMAKTGQQLVFHFELLAVVNVV